MASPDLPPIRACLFDMDGLLIDSEDIMTVITNTILGENGRPDLPWSVKAQLQGRPGPAAGVIFHEWAQLPITKEQFVARNSELQRQYFPTSQPLPGAVELLQNLSSTQLPNKVHVALATSSHRETFALKTKHLDHLLDHFPQERRVLGDDPRIPAGRGKPAPDIYLLALSLINEGIRAEGKETEITPAECLVFEDSVPGVEAGRRAGMRVIWCPHPELLQEYRGKEKEVLAGLTGAYDEDRNREEVKAGDVGEKQDSSPHVLAGPGAIDDRWAELLETLENFPYKRYGIKV